MSRPDIRMYENVIYLTQVAFIMITPIFGGLFIGRWLDNLFHGGGIWLLVCLLFGAISGFSGCYQFLMQMSKKRGR